MSLCALLYSLQQVYSALSVSLVITKVELSSVKCGVRIPKLIVFYFCQNVRSSTLLFCYNRTQLRVKTKFGNPLGTLLSKMCNLQAGELKE